MPPVNPGAHDPRPVPDRGRRLLRRARPGRAAAAALHGEHLVLGDLGLHRRDVDDLAPSDARDLAPAQGPPAAAAPLRPVLHDLAGMVTELHRRPRLALRPPRLPPGLPAQRLRRRLRRAVRRRRLRRIPGVRPHPRCQVRDLRLQHRQLLPQQPDLRVPLREPLIPLGQQFPQPRVRSPEPRGVIGNRGRLGHVPHSTTTRPRPQTGGRRTCRGKQEQAGSERKGVGGLSSYARSTPTCIFQPVAQSPCGEGRARILEFDTGVRPRFWPIFGPGYRDGP